MQFVSGRIIRAILASRIIAVIRVVKFIRAFRATCHSSVPRPKRFVRIKSLPHILQADSLLKVRLPIMNTRESHLTNHQCPNSISDC